MELSFHFDSKNCRNKKSFFITISNNLPFMVLYKSVFV